MFHRASLVVVLICVSGTWLLAHDTPMQLPTPESAGEAWNVIEQSKSNIDQLIKENLMRDVAGQLANMSIALRYLIAHPPEKHGEEIQRQAASLVNDEADLLRDIRNAEEAKARIEPDWASWTNDLRNLELLYPADVVKSEVYICPMHPADRHVVATDQCSICGMHLVRRHLPASSIYQKPGEPTLKVTAVAPPLVVGQSTNVLLRFAKADGSPVLLSDLLETHTKKIHLLINDKSLSDYHHEHPVATQTPGEYEFSFTPSRPGPYRIWADVVPAISGIQEYDITDLPAATAPLVISDRETRLSNVVDGRRYDLRFITDDKTIRASHTYVGTINITTTNGMPFTQLQPVMGAFAHLVGFSEDGKSVLHIHPSGKEPTSPEDRAGPVFAFKFYAPSAGFLRLYCQVRIDGRDVFVPFNLNIAP